MSAAPEPFPSVPGPTTPHPLSLRSAILWAIAAAACFHFAQLIPYAGYLLVGFYVGLLNLTRVNNARHGFRWGVVLGWMIYVPHLAFFWTVFVSDGQTVGAKLVGGVAVFALWMVLPVWLGLFLCLATWLRRWTRPTLWIWLIPVAWTGIEYFRGELYPLKFSWLSAGYAFAPAPWMMPLGVLGMYGVGFTLCLVAAFTFWGWKRSRVGVILLVAGSLYSLVFLGSVLTARAEVSKPTLTALPVGGVQLEFPSEREVHKQLDRLIAQHPEVVLCVLSEYTFEGPVPDSVRQWCRENERYLVAGGKDPLSATNFYNTAFVVGPHGTVVFKQVKAVPIQFFLDGLPAPEQRVWHSPWGRLGFCICYDLGYTRVTDALVKQGAQAIIAPTMDVASWGGQEHLLHARVAPIRAAEYGIPIFRLTSSGLSQDVLGSGRVLASGSYPGQGEVLVATLELPRTGSRPLDRWLAPACVLATAGTGFSVVLATLRHTLARRRLKGSNPDRA